jgi:hypothetical protein
MPSPGPRPEVLLLATQLAGVAELLELHPSPAAVPHAVWQQLIASTRDALDVLMSDSAAHVRRTRTTVSAGGMSRSSR